MRREKEYEDEAAAQQKREIMEAGSGKFGEKSKGLKDLDALTTELSADLLRSVKIWPDGRVNVELNYMDETPHAVARKLSVAI